MDKKDVKEGVKVRITGNTNGSRNQVGDIGIITHINYNANDPENILGVNVEVPERPGGPGINGNFTLLRDCELVVEKPVLVIGNKYKVAYREGFPISTTARANANNSVDEIKLNGQIVTLVRFISDVSAAVSYGNEQVTGIWSGMLEPIDEEYKLPDLWYVEITKDSLDYINQYRTSQISSVTKEPIPRLLGGTNYTYLDNTGYGRYNPVENGQELTIEEFKKYVLKLDEVPTKEQVLIELTEPANIDPLKGYSLSTYGDGGSTPGINFTTFRVGLPEKWFALGDVLVPDDTRYSLRVMSEPEIDGADFVYTLQLVTKDPTLYVPVALLAVGKEFSISI